MKRFLAVLLACVLLLGASACTGEPSEGTTTTTVTTTTATTTTTTAPNTAPVTGAYNLLTGEYDLAPDSPNRPIAVMVPNDSRVIGSQPGIDTADFYFECETEGGIPRIMAAFASVDRMPDMFGPVRSARSPFISTARAFGFIYAHCGGSKPARETLSKNVLDHFDAMYDSKTFWRDPSLKAAIDLEHSLVTGGKQMQANLAKSKYSSTAVKDVPFSFGEKSGDITAAKVQVNTTPSHRATFVYDSTTGLYAKNIGTMDNCKPHKSLEGNQIFVTNILVLYGNKFSEPGGKTIDFENGSGKGYLISGGTAREINFTRSADSLTITEKDGSAAVFATGKTYAVLADDSLASKIIFK